jgi:dTMP kinase
MTNSRGFFITFEGCEGCGKSTQTRLLNKRLHNYKIPTVLTQEPGGTPLGNKVRDLLKVKRNINISPLAELFLFVSCRSQLIADVINPALNSGKVVICDRFTDSTLVYQGYGRGLDLKLITSVNTMATGGLEPDLTVLLDTVPELGLQRKSNSADDRFEAENIAFHRKIREGYLNLAQDKPGRWLVVGSGQTIECISEIIWERLAPIIHSRYPATNSSKP